MANMLISQIGAVTGDEPAEHSAALVVVAGRGARHRWCHAGAGGAAVHRRGLQGGAGRFGLGRRGDHHARGLHQRAVGRTSASDTVTVVTDAPGIRRDAKNEPMLSPELYGWSMAACAARMPAREPAVARRGPDGAAGTQELQARAGTHVHARHQRNHRRRRRRASSTRASRSARRCAGATRTGTWSAASRMAAASPSPKRGPTRPSCSRPGAAVTASSRSARSSTMRMHRSRHSRTSLTKDPQLASTCSGAQFYADQQKLMSTIINNVGCGRWPS